jgi:hypothetical protein
LVNEKKKEEEEDEEVGGMNTSQRMKTMRREYR